MIIKVITYFSIPGKFTVEEANEVIKDVRSFTNNFLQKNLKGAYINLPDGKKLNVDILSETQAKKELIGTASFTVQKQTSKGRSTEEAIKQLAKIARNTKK